MSCKHKLSNRPNLSNLDDKLKGLIPSALEGLSEKVKAEKIKQGLSGIAGDIKNRVSNQVGNFTAEATGKLSEIGGLITGLGSDLKAGIPEDLSSIKQSVANSIASVKNEISKQYNNIKGLLECEEETTSTELSDTQETAKMKTAVLAPTVSGTKNLTNKEIKKISEDSEVKEQKTQEITNNTLSQGESTIKNSKSNKATTEKQTEALNVLQTTSLPVDDKFKSAMGEYYQEYESLSKKLNLELDRMSKKWSKGTYEALEKLEESRRVERVEMNVLQPNIDRITSLFNTNQISVDLAKINLEANNQQYKLALETIQYIDKAQDRINYNKKVVKILETLEDIKKKTDATLTITLLNRPII